MLCTLTCPHRGWTYDLNDGELVAILSDTPDSAICGKVRLQTYPVMPGLERADVAGQPWSFDEARPLKRP